jgi:hypothetical protein
MRDFYRTTEFWLTIATVAIAALMAYSHSFTFALFLFFCSGSYAVGRTIFKRNRGHFESALLTSEFWLLIISWIYAATLPLDQKENLYLLAAHAGLWAVCRGFTKGLATKPSVFIK